MVISWPYLYIFHTHQLKIQQFVRIPGIFDPEVLFSSSYSTFCIWRKCYFLILHDSYEFTWISIDIRIITFHIFLQKHAWVCLFGTAGVAHMLNRVTGWPSLGIFPMPNAWRRLSIFGVPFPNWQSQGGWTGRVGMSAWKQRDQTGLRSSTWKKRGLVGGFNIFYFNPLFGEDEPILTCAYFSDGWLDHQKKGWGFRPFGVSDEIRRWTLPKGKYT